MAEEKKRYITRIGIGKWLKRKKEQCKDRNGKMAEEKKRNNARTEMGKWLKRRKGTLQGPEWENG